MKSRGEVLTFPVSLHFTLLLLQVEINLKRYPTPYPEDLKNMVKSVQSLVGKGVHPGHVHQHQLSTGTATSAGTNMEHTHHSKEPYEPPWPLPPKEVLKKSLKTAILK